MSDNSLDLPPTGPFVDRIVRIFRDKPHDDTSALVLRDYAAALARENAELRSGAAYVELQSANRDLQAEVDRLNRAGTRKVTDEDVERATLAYLRSPIIGEEVCVRIIRAALESFAAAAQS